MCLMILMVPNDAYGAIRTTLKICGNFPQIHLDQHIMKKVSFRSANLGGSQESFYLSICFRVDLKKKSV